MGGWLVCAIHMGWEDRGEGGGWNEVLFVGNGWVGGWVDLYLSLLHTARS